MNLPLLFLIGLLLAAALTQCATGGPGAGEEPALDLELQAMLERIDARLGEELGLAEAERRCGLIVLSGERRAVLRGDEPAGADAASGTIREMLRALPCACLASPPAAFLLGLKGRNAGVAGERHESEGFCAESARIEHGRTVYLLAAAARHAVADTYLQQLARAVDEELCGAEPEKPWVHQFALREGAEDWRLLARLPLEAGSGPGMVLAPGGACASHESPVLEVARGFNEALLSWNVDVPQGSGFVVELRVGRVLPDTWSPWLRIGSWGNAPLPGEGAMTSFAGGKVDIDVFHSEERYDRLQYRVRAEGGAEPISIRRVACCLSDGTGLPWLHPDAVPPAQRLLAPGPPLGVPFFSQADVEPSIRRRVCSPLSVAMVLAHYGQEAAPALVAERLFDAEHGIYGNWARAVQGAYGLGVPGFLARFSAWDEVERLIAAGRPLIVTIAAEKGQLQNAPYESTNGHLLVVTGFDAAGNVAVNDSAAATAGAGQVVYLREQMEQVWMRRGGTAYVLLPPRR